MLASRLSTCVALAVVVVVVVSHGGADDVTFYNPMSSSSYARVQYANNNNSVIRRLGAHRDPTIQYVNFDDLYNKHNVNIKQNFGLKTDQQAAVENDRRKFDTDVDEEAAAGGHGATTTTARTISWEDAPDLTNGWTIEKQAGKMTSPMPSTSGGSKVKPSSSSNKGIDYVYAYSNVYNAYNEHDNFPKRNSVTKTRGTMAPSTTTTTQPPQVNSYADGPGLGTAEYAHYSNVGDVETLTSSVNPPVVMEASWTDQQLKSNINNNQPSVKPVKPTQETLRNLEVTTSVKRTVPTSGSPPQPIRRNGNGVQSDWRPFSGPTSTATTQMTSTEGTLFYADTQTNKRPNNEQQLPFENVPVFVMDREPPPNAGPSNVVFPSPMDNEINRNEGQPPSFPQLQPSASISVSGNFNNERPSNQVRFQPNMNRFERPINLNLPSIVSPPSNERPPMMPSFQQQHRPQFGPPPPQHQQRPQPWGDRFNNPNNNNNNGNRRPVPFGMRNPPMQRPDIQQMPSGPVGLSPQLQPSQGRPDQDHMTIRLPLPKPGVGIGSSPQNPLPGPPIFLQQQPSAAGNNDRIDGPQTQNPLLNQFDGQFNQIQGGAPPPPPQFGPPGSNRFPQQQPPNFRPPPQQFRPPQFFPPPPPPTSTSATSFIKSFFSKIFPFARSLEDDGVPIVDDVTDSYNQTVTSSSVVDSPTNVTTVSTP